MYLLHTSDWHLGQSFHQYSREYEHQCFLDWLLAEVAQKKPDALCIAGDVFDTVNPGISAQRQLFEFLVGVNRQSPDTQVIMIAGNHDSGSRIEMPAALLAPLNCHVAGRLRWNEGEPAVDELIVPVTRNGDITGFVVALPFLRSIDLGPATSSGTAEEIYQRIPFILQRLQQAVQARQQQLPQPVPVCLMLHAHLRGGQSGDSERNIVIGGSEAWPAQWLNPYWDYVALGHLHRAQKISQQDRIRYSGSPLPLSLSEISYTHQILDVVLATGQAPVIQPVLVPRAVPMVRLVQPQELSLEDWLTQLASYPFELAVAVEQRTWLELVMHFGHPPPPDFRVRCEKLLPAEKVRLLRIQHIYPHARQNGLALMEKQLTEAPQPAELFVKAWQQQFDEVQEKVLKDFMYLLQDAQNELEGQLSED